MNRMALSSFQLQCLFVLLLVAEAHYLFAQVFNKEVIVTFSKPVAMEGDTIGYVSNKITPICIPSIDDAIKTYDGVTATVAGWGNTQTRRTSTHVTSTDQLLKVDVPVLSNRECQEFYRWIKRFSMYTSSKIHGLIFSFHLCTHEPETRSGHCQGDSGGPLFLLDDDNRGESKI